MSFYELVKIHGVDFCFNRPSEDDIAARLKIHLTESNHPDKDKPLKKEINPEYRQHLNFLKFLVKNNYLDENYIEYTSSYQSNLLTSNDAEFIKKVQRGEQDFRRIIDNIEHVIDRLKNKDFCDHAVLNSMVFANLEKLEQASSDKFANLMKMLVDGSNEVLAAIIEYIQVSNEDEVIKFLTRVSAFGGNDICSRLIESGLIFEEKKNFAMIALIVGEKDYNRHKSNHIFMKFLNQHQNYESLFDKAISIQIPQNITNWRSNATKDEISVVSEIIKLRAKSMGYSVTSDSVSQ